MQTIDIYTTPQCGFCKALKAKLAEKNIIYANHDVTANDNDLQEMRTLSGGALSVPVTVLDKGTERQKVFIGYPDAAHALGLEETQEKEKSKEIAALRCPKCGHTQTGAIPTTSCVPFYVCEGCHETIRAEGENCCVFCSYADKQCPLKQNEHGCSDEVCKI